MMFLRNKFNALLTIVVIILFAGCQAQQSFMSGKLSQAGADIQYIYTLPKTVLEIQFQFVKRTVTPGPYHAYASDFLDISGAANKKEENYEILSVSVESFEEPDYSSMYYIKGQTGELLYPSVLDLKRNGLLFPSENTISSAKHTDAGTQLDAYIPYKQHIVRNKTNKRYQTHSGVQNDTMFNATSNLKSMVNASDIEDKARQTADAILRIREWRLELLGGQLDFMPEGSALQTSLAELRHMENEYMALFIGRESYDTVNYSLFFVPGKHAIEEHKTLMYFSPERGPSELYQNGSLPVEMHIFNKSNAAVASTMPKEISDGPLQNRLFYRVPGTAEFHLTYNTRLLINHRMQVHQYGVLTSLKLNE